MHLLLVFRDFAWVWLTVCTLAVAALQITTKSGKVNGFTQNTVVGKDVDVFLGIPYGAPTGGGNRFSPPKAAEPWSGVLDATKLPGPCHQVIQEEYKDDIFASSGKETEDCLKLNIWTPSDRSKKHAVMVWIHPGGFAIESAVLPLYDGAVLSAQEDVVVVTVDYRLSGFGFLYFDHPLAPGNVGLMDQVLALQWVKNNIEAFGGDSEKVTIFGESAGGASVGFHLLLPESLDLFKNAILQSGTATNVWATSNPANALKVSLLLAERAGCSSKGGDREKTIRCLQNMSAEKLVSVMLTIEDVPMKVRFNPVVDGKFLTGHPSDLLSEGKFCDQKNVLIGFTKGDGFFLVPIYSPHLNLTEDFVFTEEEFRQVMLLVSKHNEMATDLQLDMVKFMYTDWTSSPEDRISSRQQLVHLLTDRVIACGAIEYANKISAKGNNVFMFRFDHILVNETSFTKMPHWAGAVHGDELSFIFGHPVKKGSGEEARLSKWLMRYWANFAKQGDPNDGYLQEWPKYTTKDKLRLQVDGKALTVGKTDRLRECAFWSELFPKTDQESK